MYDKYTLSDCLQLLFVSKENNFEGIGEELAVRVIDVMETAFALSDDKKEQIVKSIIVKLEDQYGLNQINGNKWIAS